MSLLSRNGNNTDSFDFILSFIHTNHHSWEIFQTASSVDKCKFLLVFQHWCVHVQEAIEECCLRFCPYFYSNAQPFQFVSLGWLARQEVNSCATTVIQRCCFQVLFKMTHNILVQFSSTFFSRHFIKVQVVQQQSSSDMAIAWKNSHFILSERSDSHMVKNQSKESSPCFSQVFVDIIFNR